MTFEAAKTIKDFESSHKIATLAGGKLLVG
jgi:hypothetical protein